MKKKDIVWSGIANLKKRGLGDIFFSSIFAEAIAFLISVLIVRLLTKEEYGYYTAAYNIYGYIAVFIGCGLNNGILQYCSENREENEKTAIYIFCIKFGTMFNIAFLGLMPIAAFLFFDGMQRYYFILMSGWPIVAYLSSYWLMRLRVSRDNRHFMLSNVLSSLIFLFSVIVLVNWIGVTGYIIALYIKYISSFLVSYRFAKKENDEIQLVTFKLKKEIVIYSLTCCLTNFASQILLLIDVTCVNSIIGDPAIVATYKAATIIPTALSFVPSSIMVFAYPYLAENNSNYGWLKKYSIGLIAGVFAINVLITAFVYVLAPVMVSVLWGEKYLDAVPVLRILVISFLITGSFNMVFGNILVAVKKVKVNLIKTVIFSGINIILDILLINRMGSIGAAVATLIVAIGTASFSVIYFYGWIKKHCSVV